MVALLLFFTHAIVGGLFYSYGKRKALKLYNQAKAQAAKLENGVTKVIGPIEQQVESAVKNIQKSL